MPEQQKVLITGGHGFLGRHAARTFADTGFHVTTIGRGSWSRDEARRWGVAAWHDSDITLAALASMGGEPDVLVHCAGSGRVAVSLEQPLSDFQDNVDTTAAALEFARTRAPGAVTVFISSAAVYGEGATGRLRENEPAAPVSPYGVHKHLAEQLCASYSRQYGLRVRTLRMFSLYGPWLRKQLLWDACNRLSAGSTQFSGSGNELRDWLHVTDAAALVLDLARAPLGEYAVVNGGTGEGVAVTDILAELSRALGVGPATFSGRQRPGDPRSLVADETLARSLGWQPRREWREGVREYVDWYRDNG